ncbi:MAG: twin transmembrane helix small protein [Burkholderiales bacterium]|nr:twin transmembrane helix small protein [Burkholderiales bacterium]PZN03135.1 MAG: twin transmembrane helix small protein [Pseudomonadota bacterium]
MRYLVVFVFVLIVASLASALFFLVRDRGQSRRTVRALAVRVGLSLALFLFLMLAYRMGWITGRLFQ